MAVVRDERRVVAAHHRRRVARYRPDGGEDDHARDEHDEERGPGLPQQEPPHAYDCTPVTGAPTSARGRRRCRPLVVLEEGEYALVRVGEPTPRAYEVAARPSLAPETARVSNSWTFRARRSPYAALDANVPGLRPREPGRLSPLRLLRRPLERTRGSAPAARDARLLRPRRLDRARRARRPRVAAGADAPRTSPRCARRSSVTAARWRSSSATRWSASSACPAAREDDALRACRAALEMQARVAALNAELEQRFHTRDRGADRLNSGEVVRERGDVRDRRRRQRRGAARAGGGGRVRCCSARRPSGSSACGQSRGGGAARGEGQGGPARRVPAADRGRGRCRPAATPLVGRTDELVLLEHEVESALADGRCRLMTIVGEPGVGKSRLAAELLGRVGRRRAHRPRRLPLVRRGDHLLAGGAGRARARGHPRRGLDRGGAGAGAASGSRSSSASPRDRRPPTRPPRPWRCSCRGGGRPAARRLRRRHPLGRAGAPRPAGQAAGGWIGDAPVIVLCLARPELLETPARLAGDGAARAARCRRGRRAARPASTPRRRCGSGSPRRRAATRSTPRSSWRGCRRAATSTTMPTTPERAPRRPLDRLEGEERDALERGAVEGELFHQAAVVELSSRARAAVGPRRARRARAQGPDPARGREPRRRRHRVPVQAHPRPRGRLPRDGQEAPRRPARAVRGLARAALRASASPSTTRSSATTSSRRTATARSSARSTLTRSSSPRGRPTISAPRAGARTTAPTCAPPRTSSGARLRSCRPTASSGSSCSTTSPTRSTRRGGCSRRGRSRRSSTSARRRARRARPRRPRALVCDAEPVLRPSRPIRTPPRPPSRS